MNEQNMFSLRMCDVHLIHKLYLCEIIFQSFENSFSFWSNSVHFHLKCYNVVSIFIFKRYKSFISNFTQRTDFKMFVYKSTQVVKRLSLQNHFARDSTNYRSHVCISDWIVKTLWIFNSISGITHRICIEYTVHAHIYEGDFW